MSKKNESKWLSYYFGINFVLIAVVTVFSRFFNIPPEYTGGLVLLILTISFFLITSFLSENGQEDQQEKIHIPADDRNIKKRENLINQIKQLREENTQLKSTKNKLASSNEAITQELEQIKSVFPLSTKAGKLQFELMSIEGTTYQLQQLIIDNFKPVRAGLIGLEENIAYVYSLQLYKLVHNLSNASPDEKRELLSNKCKELNSKMSFVKMVNYNLGTTYNPVSHYCIDGNPGNNDTVQVHSFKIENSKTGEILRKSAVSIGDIVL